MKISYNWLKNHIELSEGAEKIGELLTASGLEVEKIEEFETVKGGLKGLVIGEVLTCEKHPDADKLKKTTVKIDANTVVPVVCGASNVAAGQKVILATVGATLYPSGKEPFKISKAKIRGEVSEGMICAEDEIGLGTSHEGIIVLKTDLPAGTPAAEYFKIEADHVFEIGLTPNRADAASHFGVARDLRAILNKNLKKQNAQGVAKGKADLPVKIKIEEPKGCARYSGITIKGVTVKDSPEWLQNKLKAIGLAPINNVVDITNYILHDLGQPLHAFDYDKIAGGEVIVKTVPAGTKFITLDNVERKLSATDLMICNTKEPMCIAGVFGGKESGVTDSTKNVFLESAYFSADYVRKTSLQHGLKTDASFRFERGTDPEMPVNALKKAVTLILEIAGGEVASDIIDIYPSPVKPFVVETEWKRIFRLIGKEIDKTLVHTILKNLDIHVEEKGEKLTMTVPPYRVDVQREADIVEEILRIYGYNNIEITGRLSASYLADFPVKDKEFVQELIADLLVGKGFNEIITNSLTAQSTEHLVGDEQKRVEILNKLSEELGVMRQSLLFTGLNVLSYNINRKQQTLKFFEFGKTYFKNERGYFEKERLGLFITGNYTSESWVAKEKATDFHFLYSVILNVLEKLGLSGVQKKENTSLYSQGLSLTLKGKELVNLGYVSNQLLKAADIKQAVLFADFDMEAILNLYTTEIQFKEIPKFPEVRRDLSLVLDQQVSFDQIKNLAAQKEKALLKEINLFDVYQGENLGKGKKSYSLSFILQDPEQTLTDKVIDKTMQKLMEAFEKELGAVIRK